MRRLAFSRVAVTLIAVVGVVGTAAGSSWGDESESVGYSYKEQVEPICKAVHETVGAAWDAGDFPKSWSPVRASVAFEKTGHALLKVKSNSSQSRLLLNFKMISANGFPT